MGGPRLTLAIEASNPSAAQGDSRPGVALGLVGGGAVEALGVEPLRSQRRHDDDLLPAIDRLWTRVGRPRAELGRVAVSVGPGGYTGLRVAVAAAKTIAEATGAACVPVPSARVVAFRTPPGLPSPFAVALASKGETTVVTVFAARESAGSEPTVIDADGVAGLGVGALVGDRFLPGGVRSVCAAAGMVVVPPVFDPLACLEASAWVPDCDPLALAPIYGREPEAVRKWRELHGPGEV